MLKLKPFLRIISFFTAMVIWSSCTVSNNNSTSAASVKLKSIPHKAETQFYCRAKFLDNQKTLRIYLKINDAGKKTKEEFLKDFSIYFRLVPEYQSRSILSTKSFSLSEQNFVKTDDGGVFTMDLDKIENNLTAIGFFEVRDNATSFKNEADVFLRFKSGKIGDFFTFFKENQTPVFDNYVLENENITLKSLDGSEKEFTSFYYDFVFDAAPSPLSNMSNQAKKVMTVDSTFTIKANVPINLKTQGLYYFTKDTTDRFGIGMCVRSDRYPRMTYPSDLQNPLLYISASAEIQELFNTKEKKAALDRYWLTLMNDDKNLATLSIKNFYRKVAEANQLFSNYKEGWKTDKGMIWIVMGEADKIEKYKDREVWTYTQNAQFSEINFNFVRRNNQFFDEHFELQRHVEYQSIWYPMVEKIRNGDFRN